MDKHRTIVIMIDGVSADYVDRFGGRLPHLSGLAASGARVRRLEAGVPGISLAGRASILTGVGAERNGVYGNAAWRGDGFDYAAPADVRVPTLAARAKAAGLRTAAIGMGMIRPEDVDLYRRPWWIDLFVQRARDVQPVPANDSWLQAAQHRSEELERITAAAGVAEALPDADALGDRSMFGFVGDQIESTWAALALTEGGAQLVFTEILMPDSAQHKTGFASEASHWSIAYSDALVGQIVQRLRTAGMLETTNLFVLSDHGHGDVERALRPELVLPGHVFAGEGGLLHLHHGGDAERLADASRRLAAFDVVPYDDGHLPEDLRGEIAVFLAPDGMAFETGIADATEPIGAPTNRSSHSVRPGLPSDDRFFVASGPDVPKGLLVERASAKQVAPTIAKAIGLDLAPYEASPIF